ESAGGGAARWHLSGSVGEVLAGLKPMDGQSPALEIAWHFLRAGEPSRALPTGLEGAKRALNVGAPSEAEQILAALLSTVLPGPAGPECKLPMDSAVSHWAEWERGV